MTAYYFGAFQLHNPTAGYIVMTKNLDLPVVKSVEFPMARRDGSKKSGEHVESRQIHIPITVVSTISRNDLLNKLDTLQQALALRSQILQIHENDSRYYQSVDCISAPAPLPPGNVVQCVVQCVFLVYDPYAYASTLSTYDTGTATLTSANSLWNFPAINVTGGGTYYSYPLLHIINKSSTGSTTLTTARNNGSNYTTLPVNATGFSASIGDILQLSSGGNTQNVTVATAFSSGATTLTVNSFTANATYGIGATVAKVSQWTSISITQVQDSQTLTANTSTAVPLPKLNADYIDIQCDPAPVQGWTIQTNGSGKFSDPSGPFPVIEPGTTTFNIAIACASAVSAEAILSWKARWLS